MSGGDVSPASTLQSARDRFAYFLNKRDDLARRVNAASMVRQTFLERLVQHEDPDYLVSPRETVIVQYMGDMDMGNEQSLRHAISALLQECVRLKFRLDQARSHTRELMAELGRLGLNTSL